MSKRDDKREFFAAAALIPPEQREFTEAELARAREDLIDDFVTHGRTITSWSREWSLADFIDMEINAASNFPECLASVNGGLYSGAGAGFVLALDAFYRAIVAKHLPDDLIEERAEEIEADSDNDTRE